MKLQLLSLLLASLCANAQQILVEETSFGYGSPRSPDATNIPGWKLLGEGHDIQLLSDKVVLTPPYPGNTRGAVWAEHTTSLKEWTADFDFRASGGERAGGNLQLWYTNNGQQSVGTSSIYTVGKFDGLAIVIDSHGGGTGSIRGFLNDGNSDYQSRHPAIDSLAFGHCEYSYRNLGRPSRLQLKHNPNGLEVRIDDRLCFSSNVITLPPSYNFGITAATSETPDSFEVFKFIVTSGTSPISPPPPSQEQQQQQQQQQNQQPILNSPSSPDPQLAASIQSLSTLVTSLGAEFQEMRRTQDSRHQEILRSLPRENTISGFAQRLQAMEKSLSELRREIQSVDHTGQFTKLRDQLAQTHLGITDQLPASFKEAMVSSAPRTGFLLTMVILIQIALAVSYVVYKRRRANSPKKLL